LGSWQKALYSGKPIEILNGVWRRGGDGNQAKEEETAAGRAKETNQTFGMITEPFGM
jgi:hypothetical protein